LAREGASVYCRKRHLHCALRCRCIYAGNEVADFRSAGPERPPVGALDACPPLPRFALNRFDGKSLVLHVRQPYKQNSTAKEKTPNK
jgi:hypothetical protein